MESALSRFLVGLSVKISRSDGEKSSASRPNGAWNAFPILCGALGPRSRPFGHGDVSERGQMHGDGGVVREEDLPWEGGRCSRACARRRAAASLTLDEHVSWFQIQVTELCALNPELLDHINNVLGNAPAHAPAPAAARPAPDKVRVGLIPVVMVVTGERV